MVTLYQSSPSFLTTNTLTWKRSIPKGQTTYLAPQSPEEVIAPESMVPRSLALSAQRQAMEAYTALGMRGGM